MRGLRLTGSWWIFAALALAAAAPHVYFAFGEDAYGKWSRFMFHTPPGLLVYSLLVLSIVLISVRILLERFHRVRPTRETVLAMDAWTEIGTGQSPDSLSRWLEKKGFRARPFEGGILGCKGKFSFVPGTVLRLGLVVFMVSLLASAHARRSGEALLSEGLEADVMGRRVKLLGVEAELPREFLQVGDRDAFMLDRVGARIALPGGMAKVTSEYPVESDGLFWRITHVGYMRWLKDGDSETPLALDVLPPGRTQTVPVAGKGTEYVVSLIPEKTVTKGLLKGKLYNLAEPIFGLELKGNPGAVAVRAGDAAMRGGVSVSLEGDSLYVEVLAVYDPALPWVKVGLLVTLLGAILMLSRFFWYEKRFVAVFTEGNVLVGYEEEFFRKWGIYKFRKWSEAFLNRD